MTADQKKAPYMQTESPICIWGFGPQNVHIDWEHTVFMLITLWRQKPFDVVHANVGQNVSPHNNELLTSRVNPQQHKQPTNTTTLVIEQLTPPAAWI